MAVHIRGEGGSHAAVMPADAVQHLVPVYALNRLTEPIAYCFPVLSAGFHPL